MFWRFFRYKIACKDSLDNIRLPAVTKLSAHILQVGVPHVIDRKDEKMVIFLDAFPDVGVQTAGLLLVIFLGSLGLVNDARTL
jgi:hypothetical protein